MSQSRLDSVIVIVMFLAMAAAIVYAFAPRRQLISWELDFVEAKMWLQGKVH